jgi:hypothetical protein
VASAPAGVQWWSRRKKYSSGWLLHQLHHRRHHRAGLAQLPQVGSKVGAGAVVVEAVQLVALQLVAVHQAAGRLDGHGHLDALLVKGLHQPGELRAHGRGYAEVVGQIDHRAEQPALLAGNDLAHQLHAPFGIVLRVGQGRAGHALQVLAGGLGGWFGGLAGQAQQGEGGRQAKGRRVFMGQSSLRVALRHSVGSMLLARLRLRLPGSST